MPPLFSAGLHVDNLQSRIEYALVLNAVAHFRKDEVVAHLELQDRARLKAEQRADPESVVGNIHNFKLDARRKSRVDDAQQADALGGNALLAAALRSPIGHGCEPRRGEISNELPRRDPP